MTFGYLKISYLPDIHGHCFGHDMEDHDTLAVLVHNNENFDNNVDHHAEDQDSCVVGEVSKHLPNYCC